MTNMNEIASEALDVGMPIMPPGYCPAGWSRCDCEKPPRDTDVIVLHAWIYFDGDVRTGRPTKWFRYVSRWSNGWDEPDHMTDKPGARWFDDDEEYADEPSFWQALPALPGDLPVATIDERYEGAGSDC